MILLSFVSFLAKRIFAFILSNLTLHDITGEVSMDLPILLPHSNIGKEGQGYWFIVPSA